MLEANIVVVASKLDHHFYYIWPWGGGPLALYAQSNVIFLALSVPVDQVGSIEFKIVGHFLPFLF